MRSGFVSIIGCANAGKSTLVNAFTGEKVAIVSDKPQTTRARIQGIVEVPKIKGRRSAAQVVFVDTPGVHRAGSQLDRRMLQEVYASLEQRDVVIFLVDASRKFPLLGSPVAATDESHPVGEETGAVAPGGAGDAGAVTVPGSSAKPLAAKWQPAAGEEGYVLDLVRKLDCPVFLVLNKIDLVPKSKLLPLIAAFSAQHTFTEVIPISARKKDGLERLLTKLVEYLPEGQRYFPKDQFTDQPERFLVAELIRERILLETGEEVPYASAVVVERFEEPEAAPRPGGKVKDVVRIAAAIYCERPGQRAILIGKGGTKLKSIGTAARKEIESLLGQRVYLELQVIVKRRWRESRAFVDGLDWRKQLEELALGQGIPPE